MPGAGHLAGADVPQDRQHTERRQDVQAVPLRAHGQAQQHPRRPAPGAPAEPEGVGDGRVRPDPAVRPGRQRGGQFLPGPVPVDHQGAERGHHEEHQHAVQQRRPAHHEVQPVHRHQRARQTAQERRAEQPAPDPAQQQHAQRPEQRRHEPPAERVEPEQQLPEADHVLADRRVHHVRRVGRHRQAAVLLEHHVVGVLAVLVPADLETAVDERPGVLGVVRLVEYHRPRTAQVPEPHQARQQRHQQRTDPARPAGEPLGQDRRGAQHPPQPGARLRVGRHQPVAYVAGRCVLARRVTESAQPPLPRRPPLVRCLALPEVHGGRGTGHRAIVGNRPVRVPRMCGTGRRARVFLPRRGP